MLEERRPVLLLTKGGLVLGELTLGGGARRVSRLGLDELGAQLGEHGLDARALSSLVGLALALRLQLCCLGLKLRLLLLQLAAQLLIPAELLLKVGVELGILGE